MFFCSFLSVVINKQRFFLSYVILLTETDTEINELKKIGVSQVCLSRLLISEFTLMYVILLFFKIPSKIKI